jgi:uncharacterized protein (TIGR03083 family)
MTLSTERCLEALGTHSAALADAAVGHLAAPVQHCPGWSVADLVHHLTEVQWFWRWVAENRPSTFPGSLDRPERAPDDELVPVLRRTTTELVETLAEADQAAPCWTWHPARQDIGFITRHQVQEAAVHHWDAAHAAGGRTDIADDVAADAVEEFLACSVASVADPMTDEQARGVQPLGGRLVLHSAPGREWTVTDAEVPRALAWQRGATAPATGTVRGTTGELLLWLYRRVDLPVETLPSATDLVERFRAYAFTD